MANSNFPLTLEQFVKIIQLILDPNFSCNKENFWEKVQALGADRPIQLLQDKWRIDFSSNPCSKGWRYQFEGQQCLTATELINSAFVKVQYFGLSLPHNAKSPLYSLIKSNFDDTLFQTMLGIKKSDELPIFYQDQTPDQTPDEHFLDNEKYANSERGIC